MAIEALTAFTRMSGVELRLLALDRAAGLVTKWFPQSESHSVSVDSLADVNFCTVLLFSSITD